MKTPAGQRECEWKYKNEILFVPYHSDPVIVKSVETVRCRSNMVWNFKAAASEKLKRQIFTVLEYILEKCDAVLLMLINPGFAQMKGESQTAYSARKIHDLHYIL